MEITVLGEYKTFGEVEIKDHNRKDKFPHSTQPFSQAFQTFKEPGLETLNTPKPDPRTLTRYELFPPTQDGVIFKTDSDSESNHPRSNNTKKSRGYDVEIAVKGSKATWTQGGILRKILDFSSEGEIIQQTLFAWLIVNPPKRSGNQERDREKDRGESYEGSEAQSEGETEVGRQCIQQALVIILKETAKIYFPNGESYSFHLPFSVHKVWAMDLGLLLERRLEPGEEISEEIKMSGEGLPRFYMIMDPFNESQIVTIYQLPKIIPKQSAPSKTAPRDETPRIRHMNGTMNDIFNTCVYLSDVDSADKTVVTFDLLSKKHRVWRYESSVRAALPFSKGQPQSKSTSNTLMDVDNDTDLQIRTDTYFFEIESTIQEASQDSIVFSANAFDGSTVIGILDRKAEKLSCYQILGVQSVAFLWSRPALSAIGVEATRRNLKDIIILSHNGELQLWTGLYTEFTQCNVNIKQCPHSGSGYTTAILDSSKVVDIRDSVENRVNFVMNNGAIYRVKLDFNIRSNLVQECLDAISFALPTDALWDFKHRFLQLHFGNPFKDISVNGDEWCSFTTTLLSYCDPSFTPPVMSSPKLQTRSLSGTPKKPVIRDSNWDFFLDSETHKLLENHPSFRSESSPLPTPKSNIYTEMILQAQKLATLHYRGPATRQSLRLDWFYTYILVALHLVYEDRNINLVVRNEGDMVSLLILLAHIIGWNTWVDAYIRRDFSKISHIELPDVYMESEPSMLEQYKYEPPDIFRWISDIVSNKNDPKAFPTLASLASLRDPEQPSLSALASTPCERIRKVTLFFSLLMASEDGEQRTVKAIVDETFTNSELDQLPVGVALPLKEALWKCRRNPPLGWSSDALSFIGRDDLAELASKKSPGYYMKPPSRDEVDSSKVLDIHSLCEGTTHQEGDGQSEITGTEITDSDITNLRFGADMRVAEAQKMLRSSSVIKVKSEEAPDLGEDELRATHQELLCKLAIRTLALPVGRGILTFGTSAPTLSQKCPIPPINLSVKVLPSYGVMEPDILTLGGEHILNWPEFHNGVAAGLRISSNSTDVSSSWIIYNRPDILNSSHAGFLFALGLTGHLRALARSHVYRYLSFKHELTSTGLLLGLACAHRGTMNTAITRVLSVHMPALLPQHGSELNLSPLTQVACVLGIGLIYMETSHRRMAEVMLSEIGSTSGDSVDSLNSLQECHSVAAGFGLGFITLGQGNKPMGLRDMKLVDVLVSYMPGATDKNFGPRNTPTAARGGEEHGWNRRQAGIDMTSAGATVAMGLMYLKTNSKSIALKLSVPETQFLLDYVTPDLLTLRVICKAIVMWDSIAPSESWILAQAPDYLKDSKTGGPPLTETGSQSYYSILAGACFAMGLRFAGSNNEEAFKCTIKYMDMFTSLGRMNRDGSYEDSILKSTIRTCLDVVTLSAAMIVAGSGRIDFLRRLRKLSRRVKGDTTYGSHMAYQMSLGLLFIGGGGYTLGTSNRCVAALLCSLYPRLPSDPMDNRSHLQAFRHLWVLAAEPRCLVTRDASTGVCCPVPVRIHLKHTYHRTQLQMGSSSNRVTGRQGTDRFENAGYNKESYPEPHQDTFGVAPSTSRLDMMTPCLLPELSLISKIEILGPRYWPITIDLSDEGEDYSRIWRILETRSISVMRHIGHLSYTEDPLGMRGILARPFPKVLTNEELGEIPENGGTRGRNLERLQKLVGSERDWHIDGHLSTRISETRPHIVSGSQVLDQSSASYGEDFCLTFLQDSQVASFASCLCRARGSVYGSTSDIEEKEEESRAIYFTNVLYECLTMDKVEVLGVHVWFFDIANRLEHFDELSWHTLWELQILVNYYNTRLKMYLLKRGQKLREHGVEANFGSLSAHVMEDDGSETLIKVSRVTELMSKVIKRVDQAMEETPSNPDQPELSMSWIARQYFENGTLPMERRNQSKQSRSYISTTDDDIVSRNKTNWFKVWLEMNEVPGPDAIETIKNALNKTRGSWETYVDNQEIDTNIEWVADDPPHKKRKKNDLAVSKAIRSSSGMERGKKKLLKQVFSLAYPAVSLKVVDFLIVKDL